MYIKRDNARQCGERRFLEEAVRVKNYYTDGKGGCERENNRTDVSVADDNECVSGYHCAT